MWLRSDTFSFLNQLTSFRWFWYLKKGRKKKIDVCQAKWNKKNKYLRNSELLWASWLLKFLFLKLFVFLFCFKVKINDQDNMRQKFIFAAISFFSKLENCHWKSLFLSITSCKTDLQFFHPKTEDFLFFFILFALTAMFILVFFA